MNRGQKISEATRKKMSKSAIKRIQKMPHTNISGWNKGIKTNITPPNYKGKNVSYSGLHHWVKYHKGKATYCTRCGLDKVPENKKRYFEWANISGEYKRDLLDWQPMCVKCHRAMDRVGEKAWETRTSNRTRKWH